MAKGKSIIGITGGIGSGKSYVSALLREHFGIPVYDCDAEAKRLTATNEEIRTKLIQLVGPEVFAGTTLNKQCLADYLFASPEHARQVNGIIHPVVLKDFEQWAFRDYNRALVLKHPRKGNGEWSMLNGECSMFNGQCSMIVALESAILFESGFNKRVDYVLFVDAPEDVRLKRAMQRDTASEAQIRARMKMQHPEQYKSQADFVIDNSTDNDTNILEQLKLGLRIEDWGMRIEGNSQIIKL